MAYQMDRRSYAETYGPTTGDRLRLADTNLILEVEKDFTSYCDEVKFGGGKVIRDGMGQGQSSRAAGAVDTVITNALILDWWGIVKADVGIRDGRICAIGKALVRTLGRGRSGAPPATHRCRCNASGARFITQLTHDLHATF